MRGAGRVGEGRVAWASTYGWWTEQEALKSC
jgi:hypothetical protein